MVIIDPGHGGKDSGAVSNDSKESEVVLEVSKLLDGMCKSIGIKSRMTRTTDEYLLLSERVRGVEGDNQFISIHANGFENPQANGVEVLYHPQSIEGPKIAQKIQNELVKTGSIDRGIKPRHDLYVLNKTPCPAVLVEVGFITNPEEEKMLKDHNKRVEIAMAILLGLKKYNSVLPDIVSNMIKKMT